MTMAQQGTPRTALPVTVAVAALSFWSTYAYATARVNADIVAEAIQVQRWMADPGWVWSYPGQRHGGVIEYPFIALAEWIAPGNVYGFTLLRVLYIPLVGLLLGLSLRWAFPRWSLWPFAFAAAAGPAVLHGFRMISDIYPFGWLLSASGIALLYATWSGRITRVRGTLLVVSGAFLGLGIYEHASAAVFSLPLLIAGAVHWRVGRTQIISTLIGIAVGLIPMVVALFGQPHLEIVYSPTNPGLPDIAGILGLATGPDAWRLALVPNGWGTQQADESLLGMSWALQVVVNLAVTAAVIALIAPIARAPRGRLSQAAIFVSILWLSAVAVTLVMVSVVSPIWYYGTGLGFLTWITLSALPALVPRAAALAAITIVLAVSGAVSARAVVLAEPTLLEGARFKLGQARFNERIAQQVDAAGVRYLYGDYWEVLPIAYASARALTPITFDTNRFPLEADNDSMVVGLTSGYLATPLTLPRWTTAAQAESRVTDNCTERPDINAHLPDGVRAFECPSNLFVKGR